MGQVKMSPLCAADPATYRPSLLIASGPDQPPGIAVGALLRDHNMLTGDSIPPDDLAGAGAFGVGAWAGIGADDVVLGIAPLFHISGVILNAAIAVFNDAVLLLVGRYEPDLVLEAFAEHEVTFIIGSITAFNSLMSLAHASAEHFRSVRLLYSGGAPIPPATVQAFQQRFGHYIHNVWGMTETTAGGVAGHAESGPGCTPPAARCPSASLHRELRRRSSPATGTSPRQQ